MLKILQATFILQEKLYELYSNVHCTKFIEVKVTFIPHVKQYRMKIIKCTVPTLYKMFPKYSGTHNRRPNIMLSNFKITYSLNIILSSLIIIRSRLNIGRSFHIILSSMNILLSSLNIRSRLNTRSRLNIRCRLNIILSSLNILSRLNIWRSLNIKLSSVNIRLRNLTSYQETVASY